VFGIESGNARVSGDGERASVKMRRSSPDQRESKRSGHSALFIEYSQIGMEHIAHERKNLEPPPSGMEVDIIVGIANRLGKVMGDALGNGSRRVPRAGSGEVLTVFCGSGTSSVCGFVDDRNEGQSPGELPGIDRGNQFSHRFDSLVFVPVNTGGDKEVRAWGSPFNRAAEDSFPVRKFFVGHKESFIGCANRSSL
jgi:hypothetical protein